MDLKLGLTGVIAGICTWVGDKFKNLLKNIKEFDDLSSIGISATLSIIFSSPLFGFIEPLENEDGNTTLPKKAKIVLYFLVILSAFAIFSLLSNIFRIIVWYI